MKEAFYIENKSYWINIYGSYEQVQDAGDIPIIYTSKRKAIKRVNSMIKLFTETMQYTVSQSDDGHPAKEGRCIYACTLQKNDGLSKLEIRIYPIYIH